MSVNKTDVVIQSTDIIPDMTLTRTYEVSAYVHFLLNKNN